MPCGIKEMPVESEKVIRLTLKKLDNPLRKKPRPPILTANAQKILLSRRDPSM